jgi:hypothetical protein
MLDKTVNSGGEQMLLIFKTLKLCKCMCFVLEFPCFVVHFKYLHSGPALVICKNKWKCLDVYTNLLIFPCIWF